MTTEQVGWYFTVPWHPVPSRRGALLGRAGRRAVLGGSGKSNHSVRLDCADRASGGRDVRGKEASEPDQATTTWGVFDGLGHDGGSQATGGLGSKCRTDY